MRHRVAAMALAITVHAALLAMAVARCTPAPAPAAAASAQAAKTEPLTVTLLPASPAGIAAPCADAYAGLGFTHSWSGVYVQSVASGGPADLAGLRVGDLVLNLESLPRWSAAGHLVSLLVRRDGREFRITAETAMICFEQT
jgi:C-terminal processing protease CtpA/Prc